MCTGRSQLPSYVHFGKQNELIKSIVVELSFFSFPAKFFFALLRPLLF